MARYLRAYSRNRDNTDRYICLLDVIPDSVAVYSLSVNNANKNVGSDIWNRHPKHWPDSYKLISWEEFKLIHDVSIEQILQAHNGVVT